jgi:predicted nuclease with RNAse H fold
VFKLTTENLIGIDLAGKPENPTGIAFLKQKIVKTCLVYADNEILASIKTFEPSIVAIDAPLKLPRMGILRKADREMIKMGYRVFPPTLPAMKMLTIRAAKLSKLITEEGYKIIEVHPTSTRKALSIPPKDWGKIQTILKSIGLEGDLYVRTLTPHEIDAITSALTAYLHIEGKTKVIGDEAGGFIIVPEKQDWRALKI